MTEEQKKDRGEIMFRPASTKTEKKLFGLLKKEVRTESNFELFSANCMIEMLVFMSDMYDRLGEIEKSLAKPEPKTKAKTKTKAKAKRKSKSKAKGK